MNNRSKLGACALAVTITLVTVEDAKSWAACQVNCDRPFESPLGSIPVPIDTGTANAVIASGDSVNVAMHVGLPPMIDSTIVAGPSYDATSYDWLIRRNGLPAADRPVPVTGLPIFGVEITGL